MERGQLIAYHRKRLNLTQAELGTRVNVTAQAVSKWENGLSEPDLSTVQKLAKIFDIDIKEFFEEEPAGESQPATAESASAESPAEKPAPTPSPSEESAPAPSPLEEAAAAAAAIREAAPAAAPSTPVQPKIIVGYCDMCKRAIDQRENYSVEHHGRGAGVQYLYCPECKYKKALSSANSQYYQCKESFKKSMIWGGVAGGLVLLLSIIFSIAYADAAYLGGILLAAWVFTLTAQCFWNGFLVDFLGFFIRSFRLPMLIFSLDLDGIIWFITVKLFLIVLSGLLSVLFFVLGLFLTLIVSFFSFPFCLVSKLHEMKSLKTNAARLRSKKV